MNNLHTMGAILLVVLTIAGSVAWRSLSRAMVDRPVVLTELGEHRLDVLCDGKVHTSVDNRFAITRSDGSWLATDEQRNALRTSVYQVISHGRPGPPLDQTVQAGCNLYLTAEQPQLLEFFNSDSHSVKNELVRRMLALKRP